jgi:penicillin-binding protein 2
LLKKVAGLAVAIALLGRTHCLLATAKADNTTKPSTHRASSRSSVRRSSVHPSVADRTASLHHTRTHRRRRRYNPWRVSSFGDPGAFDNPAGEDPVVRQVALEAMGNWNGSAVVVDPNNGRILSVVNQKVALESAFTPCSTFKPVVALAALKESIISPVTEFRLGRRTHMNVTEALAHSNNLFFSKLGMMLGFSRLAEYAHEFSLGQKVGWDIPDEVPGRFPSEPPKGGGVGLVASHGLGIEVTPLQMAAIVSAIANGGTLYELQYPRTPEETAQFQPRVRRRLDDLAPYIPEVKEGMAAAVIYGTGHFAYDPQYDVYGKTGTCSENGFRLGWFASYAGQQQPKYVVVVLLRGGRMMYGPHAAEIAGRLYHGLRQRELEATRAHNIPPTGH